MSSVGTASTPLPTDGDGGAKTKRTRKRTPTPSTPTTVATVRIALLRERGPVYAEPIQSAADVQRLLSPVARTWDRERFLSIILDGKSRVIGIDEVSVGTVSAALVHPREVLKAVILASGVSIIIVHNHPSGDPCPSEDDRCLTQRLGSAYELMGIRLLDHVVLGDGRFFSFAEKGQLG